MVPLMVSATGTAEELSAAAVTRGIEMCIRDRVYPVDDGQFLRPVLSGFLAGSEEGEKTVYHSGDRRAPRLQVQRLDEGLRLSLIHIFAHRLSTITGADQIVVVKDGSIEAQGRHEDLLRHCPLYADLWQAHMGAKEGETV